MQWDSIAVYVELNEGCMEVQPDGKSLWLNIQHPGISYPASDGKTRPRSTTVLVTKNDGGVIGTWLNFSANDSLGVHKKARHLASFFISGNEYSYCPLRDSRI